ncbi:MAG: DUF1549 domain-containing protein [Candidatus Solibacter usitatus]|nr:DUF1549 domain-containing protein [Candidatus Solibacter usitatus]
MRRLMTAQLAVCALTPLTATDFNRDVRPVLSARCFVCHGPDAANRKAGLRLDVEAAAKALQSGKRAIAAGDPQASEALRRVLSSNPTLRMPPAYLGHDALTAKEIDVLTQWIKEGAAYQKHWSFLSPTRKKGQSIDSIVRARLEREGLKPAPEADRPTLIRRVSLDLTGLPPTPAEIDAFITDTSPRAYEKVVDRLLASPRYAERMAIRWLEAARYADTNGYQSDGVRSMWRWRDWVIQAFDRNMPFDKFTIEQIAGDLLPNATLDQKIASAFHRNHRTNAEGGIVEEEFRVEYVADRVETTATVWLGLTMGCARCHDHKYDPMTQKEFYQLFAFYNNVPERGLVYNFGNEEPFLPAPTPEHSRILAGHDAKLSAAEAQWKGLQPRVANDQREWEKQIRHRPTKWSLTEGQVLHLTLDDGGEPGKAGAAARLDGVKKIEAGTEIAKFDYMDPFTLAAWIKPESPNGTIVSRSEDYFEGEGYQWD